MSKPDYHVLNQCRCQKPRNEYKPHIPSYVESSVNENDCPRCGCSRRNAIKPEYQHEKPHCVDEHTWNDLYSLRQRACKFINSESEIVTSTDSEGDLVIQTCKNGNCRKEGNVLQKAQELINYTPESEFLKRIKEQARQEYPQNQPVNTSTQENDYIPYVCDKCVEKSKQILKLSEQLNSGRTKQSSNDSKNNNKTFRSIFTDRESKPSGLDYTEKKDRNNVNEYGRSSETARNDDDDFYQMQSTQRKNEKVRQVSNSNKTKEKKVSKKKSEHVSRSKKPKKHSRRVKRKSNDSGNHESQEDFEPTLKRPHENSCERCWRYASPPRSPVNKPDQRYDPNFRKAHSAIDVTVSDEYGKGDSEFQKPPSRGRETKRPQTPSPGQHPGNTKVKELMYDPNQSTVSNRSRQRTQNVDDTTGSKSPENRGANSRPKPRPRTSVPSSRKKNKSYSYDVEDLDATEYKEINVGSNRQNQNTTDYRDTSPKYTSGPDISTSREHLYNESESYERSRSSPKYSSRSRKVGPADQKKPRNEEMDPNYTSTSPYREAAPPPNSMGHHRPSMDYPQSDRGNTSPSTMQHKLYISGREEQDLEAPSQMEDFRSKPAGKTRSSINAQEQPPLYEQRQKPRSAGLGTPSCNCRHHQNLQSEFGMDINTGKLPPHPFRPCNCHSQQTQTEAYEYPTGNYGENDLCCHCRRNSYNKTNRHSGQKPRRESQENHSHYDQPNVDYQSYERHYPVNPEPSTYNPRNNSYYRNGNVDPDFAHPYSGRAIPCPYRQHGSHRSGLRNHNRNGGYESREDENYPPVEHRKYKNNGLSEPNYTPKKYCVFYMTKSKEDNGDDIEVLVEELTQRRPRGSKDSKARSVKEKMKKLLECQSDSMALRFQKGIPETGHNTQNSRVLYF